MKSQDKVIILMALMDMGVMLAKLAGRLKEAGKLGEEEDSFVRQNTVNIQSVVATMLDATAEEIQKAMEMSDSIPDSIARIINDIDDMVRDAKHRYYHDDGLKDLIKRMDDDDLCDLDGLKDLLN